jgi:hypothetical protein
MLALSTMSAGVTAVFYFLFLLFALVAFVVAWPGWKGAVGWLGLACFAFVLFWNAAASA